MIINFQRGSAKKREYSESIANFVCDKLMPRMKDRLEINVEFVTSLLSKEGVYGDCCWEDTDYRPREFTIRLDAGMDMQKTLTTLAHEMVHVKQFAQDKLKHLTTARRTRYNGEYFDDNLDYWDQPWEIEAHGRETGLFVRWVEKEGLANKPWAMEK